MGWVIVIWGVCAYLSRRIASRKNAATQGLILGLLLGPLGVIAAFVVDGRKQCPQCQTRLDGEPNACPSCEARLEWVSGSPRRVFQPVSQPPKSGGSKALKVQFECEKCRELLTWPAYDAGRRVACTSCGSPMTVPKVSTATPAVKTLESQTPPDERLTLCPDCDGKVSRRAKACPHCGCPLETELEREAENED